MAGYYFERASEGVHDDLHAKALVLEKDGIRAALVSLDLISTTQELVAEARREIERSTGIPGRNCMISATHAHTGPVLAGRHMKDGTVGWNPGVLNPRILKPAGPIDPDVPVVYFETPSRNPIALYVNHAVHLDNIGGTRISADLPYTLSRLLADVKGAEMVTLYTSGTCGDVNHIKVNWGERQQGFANAARMGNILAAAVLKTLSALKPVEPGMLQCRSQAVPLRLPKIEPQDVDRDARQFPVAAMTSRASRAFWNSWRPSRYSTLPLAKANCSTPRFRRSRWGAIWPGWRCRARSLSSWASPSSRPRPSARP
jgi:hypothetical protein